MAAPLDDCGILMLTSQCWGKELIGRVRAKLLAELPVGAVVIDYSDNLLVLQEHQDAVGRGSVERGSVEATGSVGGGSEAGSGSGSGSGEYSFVSVCPPVVGPVSWNPAQEFHIFAKAKAEAEA
eukprot:CAMPEP_0119485614 /NCGR_PEP_ID=MMETSP1344-20130328/12268_1 /TAXON_ID=236787 /ORGANISM="Florenciella parvula, Strain CCMP2471" /LENGTH=123 /DNA_ID=CAMNT_0007520303 /DNA_START=45 /DNA_END=416 /DNA_ORIENTATION=-